MPIMTLEEYEKQTEFDRSQSFCLYGIYNDEPFFITSEDTLDEINEQQEIYDKNEPGIEHFIALPAPEWIEVRA